MTGKNVEGETKVVEEVLHLIENDDPLFKTVFIHDSYLNEHPNGVTSYERLEFLGDAVIGLTISDYYYRNTTDKEGDLTEKRKLKVCRKALAKAARNLNLDKHLILGRGENNNNGRNKDKILADCFEALLGAIFINFGYDKAYQFATQVLIDE